MMMLPIANIPKIQWPIAYDFCCHRWCYMRYGKMAGSIDLLCVFEWKELIKMYTLSSIENAEYTAKPPNTWHLEKWRLSMLLHKIDIGTQINSFSGGWDFI